MAVPKDILALVQKCGFQHPTSGSMPWCKKQGFEIRRQTASHIIAEKDWRVFSVPLHDELKKGTLITILKQAGIEVEDFKRLLR